MVVAHPDDVDFGAAGTVAAFTDAGVDVAYCVVTDGDAGGSDLSVPRPEMARTRRREQLAAAAEVGVHDVTFLGHPDGRLFPTMELRRDIARVVRRLRPDRVVTQSPQRDYQRIAASHPDHLAAGEATLCAVYPDARNPFAHPELLADEGLEPHTVSDVWLMAAPLGDVVVEVAKTFDRKVAALRCHRSQVGDGADLDTRMRAWARASATAAGLDDSALAEVFQVVATG